jgi:hypothetical protein
MIMIKSYTIFRHVAVRAAAVVIPAAEVAVAVNSTIVTSNTGSSSLKKNTKGAAIPKFPDLIFLFAY